MNREKAFQSGTSEVKQPIRAQHRIAQSAQFLTAPQVCERLGISDETWRRWRKAGTAPARAPLPGRPRWTVADIERFERGYVAAQASQKASHGA